MNKSFPKSETNGGGRSTVFLNFFVGQITEIYCLLKPYLFFIFVFVILL